MPATLYHAPLACSLAARFAAAEGGVPLDIEYLNLRTKELETGGSFLDINPLGQVSVLKPENSAIITETAATILWIQSQSENTSFRIDPSHPDYFQMIRWLGFCATELHKQIFRIVFYGEATDDVKDRIRGLAPQRFEFLDRHLADKPYLLGDHFTAADAYLTWFFVLSDRAQLDASGYKNLSAYSERTLSRPLIAELIMSDTAKDEAMNQQILPK
ncbi:glutathione S-transferase C-terminal domain-containing protein [Kordiimonas sp. SCSIO 12603]|uniref:glutathione S-transferase C-terminal domain-containing protein n=1 Tax=Kordiimonas sp. SCSIO 12603 TaxID=2829596 RepID=UPI00210341DD|nr:glutathione S-transferase C-terminal domain-containing protein [Kordiimonas sp. SCSIO 12603]UTW58817.1 glutathione S-transferase C-terminal domain-containing protein [Kordiimonas sp. SCSIO 12603]